MGPPAVDPLPPRAGGGLPWVGSGLALLRDPTTFFADARRRLGDTFIVDAFGYRLFCVFSPAGVRALYDLPEADASKGLADFALLRLKIPEELMMGRRMRPHDLFGSEEVEGYLGAVGEAVAVQIDELGDAGRIDAFALGRRLGQRIGLACWAGPEAAAARHFDRLLPLLDRLDASDAFVQPGQAFVTWATGKRRERAALRAIEAVVADILAERASAGRGGDDFLARIAAAWADATGNARIAGIARDVTMLHMGSQSNLPAALAWTLVDLLTDGDLLARVRAGDDELLERAANESIRLAQRSITLRQVLQPLELADEQRTYRLEPGVLVTTMLSVNNTTAAPGLERFDPAHYDGRRLAVPLPAKELVSTFGHGSHSCPAQRFAISAIRLAVRRLVERYELTPRFADVPPRARQLGAVARAGRPCVVGYRARG